MSTFTPTQSVSEILKAGGGTGELGGRQSKDEYRKMKELEEQRKEGTAPAMVDVDTGRDINPHIPQFISQTPWYVGSSGPTLKHQRPHEERQKEMSGLADWYERGVTNKVATKFRKGACENCGAMTHKKRDCFERPRNVGARWTGEDIAPDEHLQPKLELGYDAKRDRWNGYDPSTHKQVVEEFQKLEETRKMVKAQTMKEEGEERDAEAAAVAAAAAEETVVDDEDKYAEDADMAGVTVDMDSRTRITVRNLRIREDTAKYLYNLDPNGPYYDPKSRSMRENPFAGVPGKESEAVKFSGENFIRYSGEVVDANEAQVFAWQARQKGIDVHALAEPTKLEALKKEFRQQKGTFKDEQKQAIIDKYGGEEHLNAPPKELLLAQTEHYVEYSRKGKIVKGEEKPVIRSRYDEERYHNNHTSVWGSYWKGGQWGYKCCYSTVKNSYCIGEVGRSVQDQLPALPEQSLATTAKEETDKKVDDGESPRLKKKKEKKKSDDESTSSDSSSSAHSGSGSGSESDNEEAKREKEVEAKKRERDEKRREKKRAKRRRQKDRKATDGGADKKKRRNRSGDSSSGSSSSESDDSGDDVSGGDKKLKAALKRAEKERRDAEEMLRLGDRKRKYHAKYETKAPTTEDIEAYRLTQVHSADPMANYIEEKRRKKN